MTTNQTIRKLLRFKELKVTGFEFSRHGLLILVKPYKNGCRCSKCGRRGKILRTRAPRTWRDIPVCGWTVMLSFEPREILCRTHWRVAEQIPWADAHARITYRFEYLMLRYCQVMPQKAAALLLGVSSSTLSDLLHRSVTRLREGHRIRNLRTIGIDEVSYRKRHKYATLVYDIDRARVVWIGPGKGRETIDTFFTKVLSPYQRTQIQWACCDMSEAYIGAIQEHCPQATLVLDRFHIVKALQDAVDEVRKEQWRKAKGEARHALKGLRWLLYRRSDNRSRQDTRTLKALEKGNRRIYRAWQLKDEFEQFWDYSSTHAAEAFLKSWTTSALRSRLEPLRRFVRTLRKHQAGVLAFIDTRLTNATAEGLNRIIRMIKNRASGFRNLNAFADMIFLTIGDLDIPAQIQPRFRTLK